MEWVVFIFVMVVIVAGAVLLLFKFTPVNDGGVHIRRCPLCGNVLGVNESVIAQILTQTPPQQIKIKGCRHCLPNYRDMPPEEKP